MQSLTIIHVHNSMKRLCCQHLLTTISIIIIYILFIIWKITGKTLPILEICIYMYLHKVVFLQTYYHGRPKHNKISKLYDPFLWIVLVCQIWTVSCTYTEVVYGIDYRGHWVVPQEDSTQYPHCSWIPVENVTIIRVLKGSLINTNHLHYSYL